jgi:uncharacterized protein (DUF433 family)
MADTTATAEEKLIAKYIEPHPWKGGADEVLVKPYGHSIWAIIGQLLGSDGDAVDAARAYDIPVEAVEAARAYYTRHKEVIDNRIAANNEDTEVTDDDPLIQAYIEPNPNKSGADEVRIKGYGTSVWAIIGYLDSGDAEELAAIAGDFKIPLEAVQAAIEYYRRHTAIIDNRLAANRA